MTLRDWTSTNLACLGMLGIAVLWVLSAGFRAARLDPLPQATQSTVPAPAYPRSTPAPIVLSPAILATVRANPMRPDRRRAEGRYGQEGVAEVGGPVPPPPVPAFQVVGVVRQRTGPNFAAIAWGRSPSRLVRQGDQLEGFVLGRIRADSVFLARPDTAIGLAVPGRRYAASTD